MQGIQNIIDSETLGSLQFFLLESIFPWVSLYIRNVMSG